MSYVFDFSWFYDTVIPLLGEAFGYFIAFGEVDTVAFDTLLKGETFTWEVVNIFTNQNIIISIPSYGEIATLCEGVPILKELADILNDVFSEIGHFIYVVCFGLPINYPLWLSFVLFAPRVIILMTMFKGIANIINIIISWVT